MNLKDAISAAREAFAAYENALKDAEEVKKLGPPRDLGTCIMTQAKDNYWSTRGDGNWVCSECQYSTSTRQGVKFCAHCGAEVMRFDKNDNENEVHVTVIHPPVEKVEKEVTVVYPAVISDEEAQRLNEQLVRQVHRENKAASDYEYRRRP